MSESGDSLPHIPPDSPGSSVSSRLQEEYDELLKYAVVLPNYDPKSVPKTLMDFRSSFPQVQNEKVITISGRPLHYDNEEEDHDSEKSIDENEEEAATPRGVQVNPGLPKFDQSSIGSEEDVTEKTPHQEKTEQVASSKYSRQYFTSRPSPIPNHLDVERETEHLSEDVVYTATIDPDVGRMENLLDQWTLDLKRNVLAEFGQSKIRIVEIGRQELQKERERHAAEKNQMLNEIDSLKELLHTYEQSIERKDQVISNLTHAMQKHKEKYDMMKKFSEWKIKHNEVKREAFASNLARKHYERTISQKVWSAWHSIIEAKWRNRVEKACQSKAQEVCMQLTNDYEGKIASLNEALEAARVEVSLLNTERERYEEAMKKAFMRGVCALNLEAMTMFHGEQEDQQGNGKAQSVDAYSDNLESCAPEKVYGPPKTIPQEPIYTSQPTEPPPPRVITSQGSRSVTSTVLQARSTVSSKSSGTSLSKGKVINARVTAKIDTGKHGRGMGGPGGPQTLAPPMASVIVERHLPVTKQTIGHATASKFPRSQMPTQPPSHGQIFKRLAGQTGPITVTPHIQSVKVVD